MQGFDEIYSEYFSQVYKFVLGLCRNPDAAEEITQEAFFKALKNIEGFKGDCKLSSWLCQIAKNIFYSQAQKQGRQTESLTELILSDENIEQQFTDHETALEVHKILHRLKEPYKEVFWLRTLGELSFAQIGLIFGKSESWARVTFYRAKIEIREELE